MNKDLPLKLVCVFIAFTLWLYVIGEENPQITYGYSNIPIQMTNADVLDRSGLILEDLSQNEVNVKVKARRNDILKLDSSKIKVSVDLRSIKGAGFTKLPVEVDGLPSNIELVSVSPQMISANVDRIVGRSFDVELAEDGTLADGFTLQKYEINPAAVMIKGPEKLMDTVDKAVIEVNIDKINKSMNGRYDVKLLDPSGKPISGLTVEPKKVYASISVSFAKDVPVRLATTGSPSEGYRLFNADVVPATVTIMGDKDTLGAIDEINTKPVDLTGLKDNVSYNVKLDIPNDVAIKDDLSEVKVNLDIDRMAEKELVVDDLTIVGQDPQKLNYNFTTAKVVLLGRSAILDGLDKDDVSLRATVPTEPGTYNAVITGTLSADAEGATIKSIEPSSISVQVLR